MKTTQSKQGWRLVKHPLAICALRGWRFGRHALISPRGTVFAVRWSQNRLFARPRFTPELRGDGLEQDFYGYAYD